VSREGARADGQPWPCHAVPPLHRQRHRSLSVPGTPTETRSQATPYAACDRGDHAHRGGDGGGAGHSPASGRRAPAYRAKREDRRLV